MKPKMMSKLYICEQIIDYYKQYGTLYNRPSRWADGRTVMHFFLKLLLLTSGWLASSTISSWAVMDGSQALLEARWANENGNGNGSALRDRSNRRCYRCEWDLTSGSWVEERGRASMFGMTGVKPQCRLPTILQVVERSGPG